MSLIVIATREQDVQDDLDYTFDYTKAPWLESGDEITLSEWEVAEGDGELEVHDPVNTVVRATIWIRGGTPGATYKVTNKVTTASVPNRVVRRALALKIRGEDA